MFELSRSRKGNFRLQKQQIEPRAAFSDEEKRLEENLKILAGNWGLGSLRSFRSRAPRAKKISLIALMLLLEPLSFKSEPDRYIKTLPE